MTLMRPNDLKGKKSVPPGLRGFLIYFTLVSNYKGHSFRCSHGEPEMLFYLSFLYSVYKESDFVCDTKKGLKATWSHF